jgi:hypothetical protein
MQAQFCRQTITLADLPWDRFHARFHPYTWPCAHTIIPSVLHIVKYARFLTHREKIMIRRMAQGEMPPQCHDLDSTKVLEIGPRRSMQSSSGENLALGRSGVSAKTSRISCFKHPSPIETTENLRRSGLRLSENTRRKRPKLTARFPIRQSTLQISDLSFKFAKIS